MDTLLLPQVSRCAEQFKSTYQPRGTATIISNKWTSRIADRGEDPLSLGWWSYFTLLGKQGKLITIIMAYCVCNSSFGSVGKKTAYKQQFQILSQWWREMNRTNPPDPHRQFVLDLQAWIEFKKSQGHEIILALDNNKDILSHTGSIHPLIYTDTHSHSPQHNPSQILWSSRYS